VAASVKYFGNTSNSNDFELNDFELNDFELPFRMSLARMAWATG